MRKMRKHKKINKLKVGITIFLIVLIITLSVFGRYFYNSIKESYFLSKQFFFTSDLLALGGQTYTYENWGGIDVYKINVELYSYQNTLLKLDYDLDYSISCEVVQKDKIKCNIGSEDGPTSTTGTIYKTTNSTTVTFYVTPLVQINKGETVTVKIKARTEVPYIKEISCDVSLKIVQQTVNSWEIEDEVNKNYAVLKLKNLHESGIQVTLEFDPKKVRLDLNDEIYINKISSETTQIDGNDYIKKLVFNMNAEAVKYVKFYKVDMSQSYKYPAGAASSVIKVTI